MASKPKERTHRFACAETGKMLVCDDPECPDNLPPPAPAPCPNCGEGHWRELQEGLVCERRAKEKARAKLARVKQLAVNWRLCGRHLGRLSDYAGQREAAPYAAQLLEILEATDGNV